MRAKHILIYSRYSNQRNKLQFFVFRRSLLIDDFPQIPRGTFIYYNDKKGRWFILFKSRMHCIILEELYYDQTSRPVEIQMLYQYDTRKDNDLFFLVTYDQFWFKVEMSNSKVYFSLSTQTLSLPLRDTHTLCRIAFECKRRFAPRI